jgi:MraZ protein
LIRPISSIKVVESGVWWGSVANFVFQGQNALAMDAKGRLAVPTRHREVLQALCAGALTVTKHPDGCLMIFPRSEWENFRDRVASLPMSAMNWKRVFLGNAQDVEIDNAGRILISPELRASAQLESKSVTLMGMGSHFELWDTALYAAHEAKAMLEPMPASLQDFSF